MLFHILYSIASVVLFTWATVQEDLLIAMKNELSHYQVAMPTNTLVTDITTSHSYSLRTTNSSSLQRVLSLWDLPTDVRLQMDMAAYSFEEQFQTYSFSIGVSDKAYYEQYILSAKHVHQIITLAYIHAIIQAKLIPQWETVHTHTCHHCWIFFHCCSDATKQIQRGLTPIELETVMTILQASAYDTFTSSFPTEFFLHYQDIRNTNSFIT